MQTDAIAATRFREDRKAVGLPVATDEQVKRAQRLTEQNPTLRRMRTPLGLQQLALDVPLTRRERRINRKGTDDGGIGLTLEPYRIDPDKVEASPERVAAFVDANPQYGEAETMQVIAEMAGYRDVGPLVARVERWTRSPQAHLPGHLREKVLCVSAMAQAGLMVRERHSMALDVAQFARDTAKLESPQ